MTKAEFIKAIEKYPDNASISIVASVPDEDGGHLEICDAEIEYYDVEKNSIVLF